MADVAVIARITAQDGTRDAVDANVLWMYEVYTDQAALDSHMASEAFKALGPAIRPFLAGRPELTFCKPIGGKGA